MFVGTDSAFNGNTPATNAQFEAALSVGNKVRFQVVAPGSIAAVNNISLYNLNATNNTSQVNQTLPVVAPPAPTAVVSNMTTVAGGTTGVVQANGTAVFNITDAVTLLAGTLTITKPNSDLLNGQQFTVVANTIDTLAVTNNAGVVTIALANATAVNNTDVLITAAIQALGGNFANVTAATNAGLGGGVGFVPTTIGNSPQAIANGVTAIAPVRADHNFTLLQQLAVGETITVNYGATVVTLTAGTDFGVGADVNTQAANIAAALDTALNAQNVTVTSAAGVIRLYQDATFEAPVVVTVATNPAAK
ncbi:hypothetical protein [Acetobacterium malicum]|uniref:hypothetical protein n=1 Tax=Acetobacterium malicum TaxID=52692 RepID=UPI00040B776E|nr:hypothetical protein [Acetobacterium dehalogenans]